MHRGLSHFTLPSPSRQGRQAMRQNAAGEKHDGQPLHRVTQTRKHVGAHGTMGSAICHLLLVELRGRPRQDEEMGGGERGLEQQMQMQMHPVRQEKKKKKKKKSSGISGQPCHFQDGSDCRDHHRPSTRPCACLYTPPPPCPFSRLAASTFARAARQPGEGCT